jgi:hypothetical protein
MRSCHGGRAKDKVWTTVLTDIMTSANIHRLAPSTHHTPPTAHHPPITARHMPPATRLLVCGISNSASLWIEHAGAYMEAYSHVRFPLASVLGSIKPSRMGVCHRVQLGAYWKLYMGLYLRATRMCTSMGTRRYSS